MSEERLTVFLFLEVGVRKSGHGAQFLSKHYHEIEEAAGVYSDTDVVARVTASKRRVGEILLELMGTTVPIRDPVHDIVEPFVVNSVQALIVDGKFSRSRK